METIFYQFSGNRPAEEMKITGETQLSYVVTFMNNSPYEVCASKCDEDLKWFRTKEDADAAWKKQKAARIEVLQAELKQLA